MAWTRVRNPITRYRIEVAGDSPVRNVWLSYDSTQGLSLSDNERQATEQHWQQRLSSGQRVYDKPLYRLLGWQTHGSRLVLETGLTSYKEFLGTDPQRGASPLAVSAVSITSDGQAIMNLRASTVAEMAGLWHVTPAGHPHPPSTIASATWAELHEELAVRRDEVIQPVRATGLVTNLATGKPEVTLLLRLKATASQVLARKPVDSWEYTRLEGIDWSADNIARWLKKNVESCVPVGHAALLLAGRIDFGDSWYAEIVDSIH